MKNNIEKSLQKIQEIKASTALEKRIEQSVFSLPSYHTGFNYPLIAFRVALAGIVLLLVAGLGSGVVAAAQGSHPGSVLFPLKKVIVQTQIRLTSDTDKKTVLQREIEEVTPSASPTAKPIIKIKEEDKEKEIEKEDGGKEKEVEGAKTAIPTIVHENSEKILKPVSPSVHRVSGDDLEESDN